MAQNVTVAGASYSDVPSVLLPKTGGGTATFTDVSDTTAAAADVASGKYFYTAAGVKTAGTASGGGGTGTVVIEDTTDPAGGTIRTITAVDISDTTAAADDVAQGKYFYTAGGVKTQGTASGGGSGLSYESGSITIATATQYLTVTGLGGTPKFIKFIIHDAATKVGDGTLKSVSGVYVMGACMVRATNNAGSGYGYTAFGTEAAWEASTQTVYADETHPSAAGQIYATTNGFCARSYSSSYSFKAGYTFDWQVWY